MKLRNYLDTEKLTEHHVANGYVTARYHDTFPLVIYTYSRKTVLEDFWDDITRKCRGLIVNYVTGEVVSRPFEKFFNLNTHSQPETCLDKLPRDQPMILDKLDGSLGIRYTYDGIDYIASKSSFHSDHADWATKYYHKYVQNPTWPEGYTPVFEMVCQGVQHHVVHYKNDGLYLIGLVNNETGEELGYNELYYWSQINGVGIPTIYNITLDKAASLAEVETNGNNQEGFVATWLRTGEQPLRVKIKLLEFLRLQKLLHHTTPMSILEALESNVNIDEMLANTPEVFATFVYSWADTIEELFDGQMRKAGCIYNDALFELKGAERKQYAECFLRPDNKKYSGALFSMLDQDVSSINRSIWRMVKDEIKSKGSIVFTYEDE